MSNKLNPIEAFEFMCKESIPLDMIYDENYDATAYNEAKKIVSSALKNYIKLKKVIHKRRIEMDSNKQPNRKLDRLEPEIKDMICDNCEDVDKCKQAYTHFFPKKECNEAYAEIKDDFEEDERDEY